MGNKDPRASARSSPHTAETRCVFLLLSSERRDFLHVVKARFTPLLILVRAPSLFPLTVPSANAAPPLPFHALLQPACLWP